MTGDLRAERLVVDYAQLKRLQARSAILRFAATGDPPDRFRLTFHGKGLAKARTAQLAVEVIEQHEIDLRCPYGYPRVPPDIRWVTAIFHPNVSFSGFIHLADVGLPWDGSVTMEQICERLWDVARCAYTNAERTTNYQARSWLEEQSDVALPIDSRSLCGHPAEREREANKNVIKYNRQPAAVPESPTREPGVFYIGEDAPLPPVDDLGRRPIRSSDDDDVLYIGDE